MSGRVIAKSYRRYMDNSQRFYASQTDAGLYQLLVEAITDYAIFMIDRRGA